METFDDCHLVTNDPMKRSDAPRLCLVGWYTDINSMQKHVFRLWTLQKSSTPSTIASAATGMFDVKRGASYDINHTITTPEQRFLGKLILRHPWPIQLVGEDVQPETRMVWQLNTSVGLDFATSSHTSLNRNLDNDDVADRSITMQTSQSLLCYIPPFHIWLPWSGPHLIAFMLLLSSRKVVLGVRGISCSDPNVQTLIVERIMPRILLFSLPLYHGHLRHESHEE